MSCVSPSTTSRLRPRKILVKEPWPRFSSCGGRGDTPRRGQLKGGFHHVLQEGPRPWFAPEEPHPLQAVRWDCVKAQLCERTAGWGAAGGRRGGAAPSHHDQIGLFWMTRKQRSEVRDFLSLGHPPEVAPEMQTWD